VNTSKRSLQSFYKYKTDFSLFSQLILKFFLLNQKQLVHRFSNVQVQKKHNNSENFSSHSHILSPKIIAEFAKIHLTESAPSIMNRSNFGKNLQGNLLSFINFFLLEFKHNLLGIKIICSGKWKKTRTGRKQKIFLKYGRIQTSNIANKIMFHGVSQKTKYGICSVKI
jgi:hypothetical protein